MKEIFSRQWELNIYTLKNIGVDFYAVLEDPDLKTVWIENYRKALSAELAEFAKEVREYGIGTQNGKVEIIDMLHFLVSLSHLVGLEASEVPRPPAAGKASEAELSFPEWVTRTFLALDALQNSLKWKWWAKGGGYKPEKARQAILELWECFNWSCALFTMDFDTVKNIYIAKNRVNFKRQDRDYNEDTKTEADNLAVKM